jgi:hypothetical protein
MIVRQFGRLVNHDTRNRRYEFDHAGMQVEGVEWYRRTPIMDQGDLGCCTCAALVGALGTDPYASRVVRTLDMTLVRDLYSVATRIDDRGPHGIKGQWPPTDTGSSGLAAAAAAKRAGLIREYRWVFSDAGLLGALAHGPVIMGMPWYQGMCEPDSDGRLWPTGDCLGGHEILIRGKRGTDLIMDNSWGDWWGNRGSALLPWQVYQQLRRDQLDITVPIV